MTALRVVVHGDPAPQGSKTPWGAEVSKRVGPWRDAVRGETQAAILAGGPSFPVGPVDVQVTLRHRRPKVHYRASGELKPNAPTWVDKTPDIDKCLRSTLDGLVSGGAIGDDRQVVVVAAVQVYAPAGQHPGATIILSPLTQPGQSG